MALRIDHSDSVYGQRDDRTRKRGHRVTTRSQTTDTNTREKLIRGWIATLFLLLALVGANTSVPTTADAGTKWGASGSDSHEYALAA
jgi:hypothetical protein